MAIVVGTVKKFDEHHGVGTIVQADGTGVLVYSNAINRSGLDTLIKGQRVGFILIDNGKELQAENIVVI